MKAWIGLLYFYSAIYLINSCKVEIIYSPHKYNSNIQNGNKSDLTHTVIMVEDDEALNGKK